MDIDLAQLRMRAHGMIVTLRMGIFLFFDYGGEFRGGLFQWILKQRPVYSWVPRGGLLPGMNTDLATVIS
jgi:hypothetical protein